MRNIKYIIATLLTLFLSASCSDGLKDNVKMNMEVEVDGSIITENVIEIKRSTPIKFLFLDNPDFIAFYSGEPGHEYSKREQTESSIDDINSELELSTFTQYGKPAGTLSIFLSTDFEGLTKKQADDITKLNTATWADVTDKFELPTASGKSSPKVRIPLDEYLGKKLTLAFLYAPQDSTVAQSVWEIHDLKIVNTDKKTGIASEYLAASMGFTPLDEYAEAEDAYKSATANGQSGVWNLSRLTETPPMLRIHSTAKDLPLNRDWLISSPMVVNSRTPDKGVSLKTTQVYLNEYSHIYDVVGEYTVTFIGTNENYDNYSRVIKEYTIKVVD